MPDIYHAWGGDLVLDDRGDLKSVDGTDRGTQRVIRRLMTIIGEYIFHTDYGASVPKRIGDTLDTTLIQSVIRSQIFLEAAVAREPDPIIKVEPILGGVFVSIKYVDSDTGQLLDLDFEVTL